MEHQDNKDNTPDEPDETPDEPDESEESDELDDTPEDSDEAPAKGNTPLIVAVLALIGIGVAVFIYSRSGSSAPPLIPGPQAMPTTAELRMSPTGTLAVQYGAVLANDVPTLRDCYLVDSDDAQDLADAFVAMAQGIATLRNASEQHFGKGSFAGLGIEQNLQREIQAIMQAKTDVAGNVAKVYAFGENLPPVVLVQQPNGQWRTSLAQSFADLARQAQYTRAQAHVYDRLAGDILTGKYKTVAAAAEARTMMIRSARLEMPPVTSRPSTRTTIPTPSPQDATTAAPATVPLTASPAPATQP